MAVPDFKTIECCKLCTAILLEVFNQWVINTIRHVCKETFISLNKLLNWVCLWLVCDCVRKCFHGKITSDRRTPTDTLETNLDLCEIDFSFSYVSTCLRNCVCLVLIWIYKVLFRHNNLHMFTGYISHWSALSVTVVVCFVWIQNLLSSFWHAGVYRH